MKETTNIGLQKPEGNEYIDVDILNANLDKVDKEFENKISIFIGETLPPAQERKKNTVYYRIIEKLDTGFVTENIKVSPKMGIKLVNN